MVLLEVQIRAAIGFHHRLAAQTDRFLQHHHSIEHWRAVVITPHQRLQLGPVMPLRDFLAQVHWINLEELGQKQNLDAAVDLLSAHPAGAFRAGAGGALPAGPGEPPGSGDCGFLYAV